MGKEEETKNPAPAKATTSTPKNIPYKEYYCSVDNVKEYIANNGVAVVADVLTKEELETARDAMWKMIE